MMYLMYVYKYVCNTTMANMATENNQKLIYQHAFMTKQKTRAKNPIQQFLFLIK